jgi:isopenicillin N synthase-like dioxygenase
MLAFFEACQEVHMAVMRALALGMGLSSEKYFDSFVDAGDNTVRLLHYRKVKESEFRAGAIRAGAHSDYGSITLLFQDKRGGLQVQSPTGVFVDARPIEGTVVVNAGDLLARWSNDTIRSTIHRVVEPPRPEKGPEDAQDGGEKEYPPRYSIAYFCNPNSDATIDVIPGTLKSAEDKKYDPINSGDYLVQRLAATY